jgi:hypothetical protein
MLLVEFSCCEDGKMKLELRGILWEHAGGIIGLTGNVFLTFEKFWKFEKSDKSEIFGNKILLVDDKAEGVLSTAKLVDGKVVW